MGSDMGRSRHQKSHDLTAHISNGQAFPSVIFSVQFAFITLVTLVLLILVYMGTLFYTGVELYYLSFL